MGALPGAFEAVLERVARAALSDVDGAVLSDAARDAVSDVRSARGVRCAVLTLVRGGLMDF